MHDFTKYNMYYAEKEYMKIIQENITLGAFGLIGLPFTVAGSVLLYMSLDPTGTWQLQNGAPPIMAVIPFFGLFIFIGIVIMFGCHGYKLDPSKRVGITYWGIFFPFRKTTFSFNDISFLHLKKEIRRSKNKTYITYKLGLEKKDTKTLWFETNNSNYLISRERAEKIARDCKFDLKNTVESDKIIKSIDVDKSFAEKNKLNNSIPQVPSETHVSIKQSKDESKILISSHYKLPLLGHGIPIVLRSFVSLIFLSFIASKFFSIETVLISKYIFLYLALVFIYILLTWKRGFKILLSKTKLDINIVSVLGRTQKVNIDDIYDIENKVMAKKSKESSSLIGLMSRRQDGVTIITGKKSYRIGQMSNELNQTYFYELLKYSISRVSK